MSVIGFKRNRIVRELFHNGVGQRLRLSQNKRRAGPPQMFLY